MTGLALLAAVAVLPDDGAAVEERYDVADLLTGPGGSVPASTLLGPITRVTGRADNCWFRDEQTLPHFGGRLGLRPRADGCWFRDEQTLRVEGHTLVVRRPHAVQAEVSALLSALRHADRTGVRLRGGPAVREVEPPAAVDYGTLRVDGASLAVEVGSPSVTTFRAVPPVCAASVSSRPGLFFRRPAPSNLGVRATVCDGRVRVEVSEHGPQRGGVCYLLLSAGGWQTYSVELRVKPPADAAATR